MMTTPRVKLLALAATAAASIACRDAATRDGTGGGAATRESGADASAAPDDACGAAGARRTADDAAPRVTTLPVNRGTHGMAARVRWTLSPDRCALLVVEDPASIENDPLPNGFLLATERGGGFVLQRDSVWDVAPSPDWSRVAYSRAYGLQAGGARDSLTAAEWAELARRAGLDVRVVRAGAFPSSGMATAYSVARPVVVAIGESAADSAASGGRALPLAMGWRVRWTRDGRALVLGSRPLRTADDAPPTQWNVVDAGTPPARSASERAQSLGGDVGRAELVWTDGPTIDISVAHDLDSAATIAIDGATVESRGGTVWIRTRGANPTALRVGPGVALAATRGGRFVAALAPASDAAEHEPKVRLVVYRTDW